MLMSTSTNHSILLFIQPPIPTLLRAIPRRLPRRLRLRLRRIHRPPPTGDHNEQILELLLQAFILRHHNLQLPLQLQLLRFDAREPLLKLLHIRAPSHPRHGGGLAVHIEASLVPLLLLCLGVVAAVVVRRDAARRVLVAGIGLGVGALSLGRGALRDLVAFLGERERERELALALGGVATAVREGLRLALGADPGFFDCRSLRALRRLLRM